MDPVWANVLGLGFFSLFFNDTLFDVRGYFVTDVPESFSEIVF